MLCKNKRKFKILWIWIWCVKYINTEGVAFLQKNHPQKKDCQEKKKKEKLSWWCAGPDLPNEEKKETRILVHPILTRTQQQGEYYGLVQEWKRYPSRVCTFQDVSGAVWSLVSRVGIIYEEVQKSFQRATLVGVVFGCVSEVKSYFFLLFQCRCIFRIRISIRIQYSFGFELWMHLLPMTRDLIIWIRNIRKNWDWFKEISVSTPSSKIIWSVWMAALRKGPKNIFLTHKTFTQFYVSVRQGLMRKEKKLKCFIMCLCTWCRKQISWVKCKNIRYVY